MLVLVRFTLNSLLDIGKREKNERRTRSTLAARFALTINVETSMPVYRIKLLFYLIRIAANFFFFHFPYLILVVDESLKK